jgi:hypothetical protein
MLNCDNNFISERSIASFCTAKHTDVRTSLHHCCRLPLIWIPAVSFSCLP